MTLKVQVYLYGRIAMWRQQEKCLSSQYGWGLLLKKLTMYRFAHEFLKRLRQSS